MSNSPLLDFLYLLPSNVQFQVMGGPVWLRDQLSQRTQSDATDSVLVTWELPQVDYPAVDSVNAVVAIRPQKTVLASLGQSGFRYVQRYAIVPGAENARWFIPLASRTVASRMAEIYTPFRMAAKLKRFGLVAAIRMGSSDWYGDEVIIAQRTMGPLATVAKSIIPTGNFYLGIHTGTPGPARKPTIPVLNHDGKLGAVIKVAGSQLTRGLLRQEALTLEKLVEREMTQRLAPRLLALHEADSWVITGQSVLVGKPPQATLSGSHVRFLASLVGGPSRPVLRSAMMESLPARINHVHSSAFPLKDTMDRISYLLIDAELPPTVVHGDFAPWNLRQVHGEIAAFDWEYSQLDGLPIIDELHHQMQTGFLLNGWSVADALDAMHVRAVSGNQSLQWRHALGLQMVYLLDSLLCRHEHGYGVADETRRRNETMLQTMMSWKEPSTI